MIEQTLEEISENVVNIMVDAMLGNKFAKKTVKAVSKFRRGIEQIKAKVAIVENYAKYKNKNLGKEGDRVGT